MKKSHILLLLFLSIYCISFSQMMTDTFNFTGGMQSFVVPSCVNSISFDIRGAAGGGELFVSAPGAPGGRVQGNLTVTPGQTLNIFIGGMGDSTGIAGYNGGGLGAGGSAGYPAGGGGGATDIRIGGTTLTDRKIVAGGGGGSTENAGVGLGGMGGGLVGGSGSVGGNTWGCTNLIPATGGDQSSGGFGGTSTSCAWNGTNGSLGIGGDGFPTYRCGGGGGGWYGGGGAHNGGGGGGGSSYTDPILVSGEIHTQGFQATDGIVILNYSLGSIAGNATTTAANGNLCAFDTINFLTTGSIGNVQWWVMDTINQVWSPFGSGNPYNPGIPSNAEVGTFQFIAIVTNGSCPSDTSNIITLNVRNTPVVSLGNDTAQCGNSILLDAGNPGGSYFWNNALTTQTISTSSSGIFSVVVTTSYGCMGTDTTIVTIHPVPVVTTSASSLNPCLDDAGVVLAGAPVSGIWTGNGITGTTFSPVSAGLGSHDLIYSFTDSNACLNADTITVNVNACLGTVEQNSVSGISVFPNPNNGVFSIYTQRNFENLTIEITDVQGKLVFSSNEENVKSGYQKQLDLSSELTGIYFMRMITNQEQQIFRINVVK